MLPPHTICDNYVMTDQANLAFLARQLVLTELPGEEVDTLPGGCLVQGQQLWAGLWAPSQIEDAEALIKQAQAAAQKRSTTLGGIVAVTTPADEKSPVVQELSEALYIYGYPRAQGLSSGAPELIQVQPAMQHPAAYELATAAWQDEAVQQMYQAAAAEADQLAGLHWWAQAARDGLDVVLAMQHQAPVGMVASLPGELFSRLVLLWVKPEARGAGIGRALAAAVGTDAALKGRMLTTAWTHRDGKLRYYFNKLGYDDQLVALVFIAEEGS